MIQPYYLITDGSSDLALVPVLTWLMAQYDIRAAGIVWVDFRRLQTPPKTLADKIRFVGNTYSCDLLFIHRDAEREPYFDSQIAEIKNALQKLGDRETKPTVCVVPVRMMETWLLFNESAIRAAAGKPNGTVKLDMPNLRTIENIDAKEKLESLLRSASELSGRDLRKLNTREAIHLVHDYITDYSPLRQLSAFQALEADFQQLITAQGWNNPD